MCDLSIIIYRSIYHHLSIYLSSSIILTILSIYAYQACRDLVAHTYGLPMEVMDVEYQFDRNKITVYYDSHLRIDFRELVRDLFSSYKARIWMKKINQFHAPDLKQYASAALATGVCYVPKELTVD
jgi:hypothetical protein